MKQTREDVRQGYDAAAKAYAAKFTKELDSKPRDRELLVEFANRAGQQGRVLDLGCGPGHTTDHLMTLGLDPIGMDLSPEMIVQANAHFPGSRFEVADYFNLPKPDRCAEGILALYCIVYLQDDQLGSVFGEWNRVLVDGGHLLLSFHIGTERVLAENFLDSGKTLEFSTFQTVKVEQALLKAGFNDIEIESRPPYDIEAPTERAYIFARKANADG